MSSSPVHSPLTMEVLDEHTNLRVRIPHDANEMSDDDTVSVDSNTTTPVQENGNPSNVRHSPNNHIPSPPLHPPRLSRDLNTHEWQTAYEKYTKLYSDYMVWKTLTLVLPFYIISISVSTIQYFTQHEFYWFCVFMPIAAMLFCNYTYRSILFTQKLCPMVKQLSYYPGRAYEFGIVTKVTYSYDELRGQYRDSEFWIVHNSYSNAPDFIWIENENYDDPYVSRVIVGN